MQLKEVQFSVEVYTSAAELADEDAALLATASDIAKVAYAPYSNFFVGAAAKLANGIVVSGTNQENAAYPAGICAERTLMSAAATQYPGIGIKTMAISYHNKNGESTKPISPCGVCRQVLAEFEERTAQSIRLVLGGLSGEVYIIQTAKALLPLTFTSDDLKR
ncbi:MAG: cytidine deaminase [Chitinophagaceae bacterium]|nr:cytidine deaminase [Chitinophagaceae bacterium]